MADYQNTILYNLLNLITSQGLAIILAIIISEMQGKYYKKITQSVILFSLLYFLGNRRRFRLQHFQL